MNPRDELLLTAADLGEHGSLRVDCPWCHGGASNEASLSITRTSEGVLYNCHRASCGQRGFVPTAGWATEDASTAKPVHKLQPYRGELLPLESADHAFFEAQYEIRPPTADLHIRRNERDEYVLPIEWLGLERGYNVRQPWAGAPRKGRAGVPKSKVWMHSEKPVQSCYHGRYTGRVAVLVEDQLSAIKLLGAPGVAYSIALMGTHLNVERVREIAKLRTDEVIIALDADATGKAFDHARTFGLAFKKTRVALLEKDIKDSKLSDIPSILGI